MMNKTKSAKRQLIRLLFLLPATAVLLLAFRSKWNAAAKTTTDKTVAVAGLVVDAKTLQPLADAAIYCKGKNISIRTDAKGYYLLQLPFDNKELQFTLQITKDGYQSFQQEEHWGNFTQDYIFNSYSKAIAYFGLSNGAEQGFSSLTNAKDMPGLEYPAVASRLPGIFNANSPDYDETILRDTFPKRKQTNSKGYIINIADEKGNPTVVIKDKAGKEVKRVLLNEWNDNTEKYEATYGELPPPPPPPAPPMPPAAPDMPLVPAMAAPAVIPDMPVPPPPPAAPPPPPAPPKLPANVKRLDINNNKATIWLKNGQKEIYDLNNDEQKEKFEKKYGKIAAPPVPPDAALSTQADPYFGMLIKNEITPLTLSVDGKLLAAKPLPEKMLYVLNGIVATKKEIENLNQQSVAVVRFLNCEAAVAQYGTQGSEGAYLITTATPKAGSNQVLLTPAVTSMPAKSRMPVYTGAIEISNSKKMLVLDGKELATNSTKLNGVFRLLSLTKTEALEKYGGKGNNGAIEITTLK